MAIRAPDGANNPISLQPLSILYNWSTGGRQKQRGPNFEISIFVRSCYHYLEKVSYRNIFTAANLCFFISSHQRLPDMKEVRWYHGAVVIGELCPFRFYIERWIFCPFVIHWEMNLWLFLFTSRGGFLWAGGRLYAVAGCGQLDSVEYLELESSPVGGQPGPPGQLHNQHYSLKSSISGAEHPLQAKLDRPANLGRAQNGNLFVRWRIQGICQGWVRFFVVYFWGRQKSGSSEIFKNQLCIVLQRVKNT